MSDCYFCNPHNNIFEENGFFIHEDEYPVSPGHYEVVPKRHITSFFDLNPDELLSLYNIIKKTKQLVEKRHKPDGYNIGINEGKAAGRSVHHLHIHVIPRYKGDVKNPQGGIRNVIPEKGDY